MFLTKPFRNLTFPVPHLKFIFLLTFLVFYRSYSLYGIPPLLCQVKSINYDHINVFFRSEFRETFDENENYEKIQH